MPGENGDQRKPSASDGSPRGSQHQTACLSCRQARQKCDRQEPCVRCTCHGLHCTYPARSNRGRKRGSVNKPDTVDKLLSRINDSSVRDDVIAAIVKHHKAGGSLRNDLDAGIAVNSDSKSDRSDGERDDASYGASDAQESLYSPLQILAAAVVAEKDQQSILNFVQASPSRFNAAVEPLKHAAGSRRSTISTELDNRLSEYFAPRILDRSDWEVLISQPSNSRFKFDGTSRDPVAAGLIEHTDVAIFFELFYTIRNPMIGLLDPGLHTPAYVRSKSFTLFSVICALGSAVSPRQRDKLVHPALSALAEENVKWSIAASVKSIETVQAIINMTYWNLLHERFSDDPYWLRISHATQLARELGIHRPANVAQKVNAFGLTNSEDKERLQRNFQRTWLYVFIIDKSFGMTTGRTIGVSYREVPTNLSEWWQRPSACVLDRLIVNCVDHRVVMVKAFERRRLLPRTRESVINWQKETFGALCDIRDVRCAPDDRPSSTYLPVYAFYLDHGLMAINAHASRDLISIDGSESSDELAAMSQQTMDVAMRFMDNIISNELMVKLRLGLHNTQIIMISHAANEVIHAIKRSLSADDAMRASNKVRLLANHVEGIANGLPPTSWASLYLRLFRFFVAQLEEMTAVRGQDVPLVDTNNPFADWWTFVDTGSIDFASGIDMSFMDREQHMMDTGWDLQF